MVLLIFECHYFRHTQLKKSNYLQNVKVYTKMDSFVERILGWFIKSKKIEEPEIEEEHVPEISHEENLESELPEEE